MELAPGVDYVRTSDVKDQIELSGNDIQAVSMTGKPLSVVLSSSFHTLEYFPLCVQESISRSTPVEPEVCLLLRCIRTV